MKRVKLGVVCFGVVCFSIVFVQAQEQGVKDLRTAIDQWSRALSTGGSAEDRKRAIEGLLAVSTSTKANVATLSTYGLTDTDPDIRMKAVVALGVIGPSSREAVANLSNVLDHDKNAKIRNAAAGSLGEILFESRINRVTQAAIPALVRAMRDDPSPEVRATAVLSLRLIGQDAKDALPDLLVVIKDPKRIHVRETASWALLNIVTNDSRAILPELVALYRSGDKNPNVELNYLLALSKMTHDADTVVPILVEVIRNKERPDLSYSALGAVGSFGSKAKAAVPALLDVVDQVMKGGYKDRMQKCSMAIQALGKIGPDAKEAVPLIKRILVENQIDRRTREVAERALVQIQK